MQGWIKLYRQLLDKTIWKNSTPEQCKILITLLLMANHKENEWEWQGKKFSVVPGQFITSLDNIAKECGKGISVKNIRTALTKFEKYGFLTNQSTKTGRLITIVNWAFYQGEEIQNGKVNGKEVAKKRQSNGKEVAPNKNDKNVKNEKKNIYMSDSNEYRLAEYLYKYILKNNPNTKEPNLQNWAKTFDYILRIDRRELEEVKRLISFCQGHSFWYKNILSADKFRKQYDRLVLEFSDINKKPPNKVIVNNSSNDNIGWNGYKKFG
ncbi:MULTISPECIES: hypothetical protein [Clostridium]|uniref:hypothetical protein n=1 Tax=Clostridium TaxID=1485 RepID=UPI0006527AE8|nr:MULTISPECIES: hypothetical protein [Clostridium]